MNVRRNIKVQKFVFCSVGNSQRSSGRWVLHSNPRNTRKTFAKTKITLLLRVRFVTLAREGLIWNTRRACGKIAWEIDFLKIVSHWHRCKRASEKFCSFEARRRLYRCCVSCRSLVRHTLPHGYILKAFFPLRFTVYRFRGRSDWCCRVVVSYTIVNMYYITRCNCRASIVSFDQSSTDFFFIIGWTVDLCQSVYKTLKSEIKRFVKRSFKESNRTILDAGNLLFFFFSIRVQIIILKQKLASPDAIKSQDWLISSNSSSLFHSLCPYPKINTNNYRQGRKKHQKTFFPLSNTNLLIICLNRFTRFVSASLILIKIRLLIFLQYSF